MAESRDYTDWEKLLETPAKALSRIEPGMSIFIGSGVAAPRTLLKQLLKSEGSNLQDLELIQLISYGDVLSVSELKKNKYRLKTFSSGWHVDDAVGAGLVDLIPCRFAHIPGIIETEHIPIDAAFIQITPPNSAGYCSLGIAVDVARYPPRTKPDTQAWAYLWTLPGKPWSRHLISLAKSIPKFQEPMEIRLFQ